MTYFTREELACRCCGAYFITPEFAAFLDNVREAMDEPLTVNDACRCNKHNAEVPNSAPNSAHTLGLAADIHITDERMKERLINVALEHGVMGIGRYKTFVHLDIDKGKGRRNWHG
jgi:uncharacterized protein YcbK (DUF882 family)